MERSESQTTNLRSLINNLPQNQKSLLALKLRKQVTARRKAALIPRLEPNGRHNSFPLSYAQERCWFLTQLEPYTSFNTTDTFRITGSLNTTVLVNSINEIIKRHKILRTVFGTVDGIPMQVITARTKLPVPIRDFTAYGKNEGIRKVEAHCRKASLLHFSLAKGPLIRVELLKLEPKEHILFVAMHNIITDGMSMEIFFRELNLLYDALLQDNPAPLEELSIQYIDYAAWQRHTVNNEVLQQELSYWKANLKETSPFLANADRSCLVGKATKSGSIALNLPTNLVNDINILARNEQATLFMTLLAAFGTILYRQTDQPDICIGSPIVNRTRRETEGVIGCFLNTLVMRLDVSNNPSFRELLRRVRTNVTSAFSHQDIPFEKLIQELRPKRELNRTPLFQVVFNLINFEHDQFSLKGLKVERLEPYEHEAKHDLTLYARAQQNAIRFRLVYNADLFDHDRMTELLNQLHYLLEQIVTAPEKPIRSFSLVTARARQILPNPCRVLPEQQYETVIDIFERWARKIGDKQAISQGNFSWTYGELAESVIDIANSLQHKGTKPGDTIAICGQKSFGLIASILGVLKSGGVLLTIDPTLPEHRKHLMLQESGARYLLSIGSEASSQDRLCKGITLNVLSVDSRTGHVITAGDRLSRENIVSINMSGNDPAYVFFTSGTSGTPKAVLGCHKGLSHFLSWQQETFEVGPQDRCAQLTGLSFDVVLRDIFLPLTSGAALCLPEEETDISSQRTLSWLDKERISIFHAVPTLIQSWLLSGLPANVTLRHLRCIFLAGEPLPDTLIRHWRESFAQAGEIINLYGPTETTLAKCCYRVPGNIETSIQPIGTALPATQALILTQDDQVCGINEPGEIVIRTPYRSLGYLNNPDDNRLKFRHNPFHNDSDSDLVYYTGDQGYYRSDGLIQILGRLDRQVKIRGVRIELQEIETVLVQHPQIHKCIAVAQSSKTTSSSRILVAYVIPQQEGKLNSTQLRTYLEKRLPLYMVPSEFVYLQTIPLTPNGKTDYQALPSAGIPLPPMEQEFAPPRSPVEKGLARIWQHVLTTNNISIHDNFFDLGGHSLLATRITSRIRDSFQVELPLYKMFEQPTIAELATTVETLKSTRMLDRQARIVPLDRSAFQTEHVNGHNTEEVHSNAKNSY